jgi:hypothetical protein
MNYSKNANANKLKVSHAPLQLSLVAELNTGEVVAGLLTELKDDAAPVWPVRVDARVGITLEEVISAWEEVVSTTGELASSLDEVDSVVSATVVESTGVAVVSVTELVLGVVCVSDCSGTVVVTGTRPPVSGATAYGGSNIPKLPHALQGEAHDLTGSGATRIGSHRPLGAAVATTEGASVCGQSVPRSFRVSCRVAELVRSMVETWSRSRGKTTLVPEGPARPAVL